MSGHNRPAVFFDRDGIINESPGPGYVERPEDFHLIPEFLEALRIVLERGYEAVVVTNQRGIGLGRVSPETVAAIHDRMLAAVRSAGLRLTDVLVCPATTDDHPNRKPNPGMLLEAARRHHLDLSRSWMVGDSEKDIAAGRRAGCAVTVRVVPAGEATEADRRVGSVAELAGLLARELPPV